VLDLGINNDPEQTALADRLKVCGIIPTRQRLEIAAILLRQPQHLAADQILAMVKKRYGQASKATIYNTLKLFSERGLVREVVVDPNRIFYDSTTVAHHHFYDVESGKLTDISPEDVVFERLPELPEGAKTDGVDVIVRIRREKV
jgi:Fur family iron response transcriptional regulator